MQTEAGAEKEQLAAEYLNAGTKFEQGNEFIKAIEQYELGNGILSDYTNWEKLMQAAERKRKQYEEDQFRDKLVLIEKGFQQGIYFLAAKILRRQLVNLKK